MPELITGSRTLLDRRDVQRGSIILGGRSSSAEVGSRDLPVTAHGALRSYLPQLALKFSEVDKSSLLLAHQDA